MTLYTGCLLTSFCLILTENEVLVLGPHAARSNHSDYNVSLDGLSVSSCAALIELGVIIDSSLLFEVHVDNITQIILPSFI